MDGAKKFGKSEFLGGDVIDSWVEKVNLFAVHSGKRIVASNSRMVFGMRKGRMNRFCQKFLKNHPQGLHTADVWCIVINVSRQHWVLLVIFLKEMKSYLLDSMVVEEEDEQARMEYTLNNEDYMKGELRFFHKQRKEIEEVYKSDEINVITKTASIAMLYKKSIGLEKEPSHTTMQIFRRGYQESQQDLSCGIYVMRYMYQMTCYMTEMKTLLMNGTEKIPSSLSAIENTRKKIYSMLHNKEGQLITANMIRRSTAIDFIAWIMASMSSCFLAHSIDHHVNLTVENKDVSFINENQMKQMCHRVLPLSCTNPSRLHFDTNGNIKWLVRCAKQETPVDDNRYNIIFNFIFNKEEDKGIVEIVYAELLEELSIEYVESVTEKYKKEFIQCKKKSVFFPNYNNDYNVVILSVDDF